MKNFSRIFLAALLFAFIGMSAATAKDHDLNQIKESLPKLLGANNVGTEFWFTFIPVYEESGSQNFIKVYISSGVETEVTLEIPGIGFTKKAVTVANDIIEIELTPNQAQPYQKDLYERPLAEQVFAGRGIHLTAEDPIIVYGVVRFEYTSDGFLGIPVPAFGKQYIVASYQDPYGEDNQWILCSLTGCVAAYDKTKTRFTMGGTSFSRTAGGLKPGETANFTMHEGDVVTVGGGVEHADLTGSVWNANKPIGVVSGNHCPFIPSNVWACDHIVEMELPTDTWGKEYHVTPIQGRTRPSFIRIFAKEPNTTIYRNGQALTSIPNVGGTNGLGWLDIRAHQDIDNPMPPVVISGDKPISVTQYNPGINDDNSVDTDPFQIVLTPFEQYQKEIIFNTPGIRGGFGFDNNFVNLVYKCTEQGTIPDDIMFAKVVNGKFEWTKLSAMDPFPGQEFTVKIDNQRYFSKTIRLPQDGVYKIKADAPFAAYAYGHSWCDTYGFPTSVALGLLDKNDTIPPRVEWKMECNGEVKDAKVIDMPDDEEYRSNLALIYLVSQDSYNYKFHYNDFIPAEDRVTGWGLEVIDITKPARAVISFSDRSGNNTLIEILYFPIVHSVHYSYDFGRLPKGSSATHDFWLVNETEADILITKVNFQSEGKQHFTFENLNVPFIIPALDSTKVVVRFDADEEGAFIDSIGVEDTCNYAYKAEVKANVGAPKIQVSYWDFGTITLGNKPTGEIEIKNIGTSMLHVYDYKGPFNDIDPKAYVALDLPDMSYAKPLEIMPNKSVKFNVSFEPEQQKTYIDSIVFISDTERPDNEEIDSVGELSGNAIKPMLSANGHNWGRVRIDRSPDKPAGPYDAPFEVIKLVNDGMDEVTIKKVIVKEDLNNKGVEAFKLNKADFKDLKIPAQSEKVVKIQFQPKEVGQYRLVLTYESDAQNNNPDEEVESILEGVGIVPEAITYDYDFGETLLKENSDRSSQTIKIRNLDMATDGYEWNDDLTITDLTVAPNTNDIAKDADPDVFGDRGFRYDPASLMIIHANGDPDDTGLTLPVTLAPGDELHFNADFVAQQLPEAKATITTVSDAASEVTSEWKGAGGDVTIAANITGTTICVGETFDCDLIINNTGSKELVLSESPTFDPAMSEFTFKDNFNSPTVIFPNSSFTFPVTFQPNAAGDYTTKIVIKSNAQGADAVYEVNLTCTAVHFDREITLVALDHESDPTKENMKIEIGQHANFAVHMGGGDDMSIAEMTHLTVKLQFDSEFIKLDRNNIKSKLDGFDIKSMDLDDVAGLLTVELESDGSKFLNHVNGSDLLNIRLGAYLPKDGNLANFHVEVIPETNNYCISFDTDDMELTLGTVCANEFRKIDVGSTPMVLNYVSPNPATGSTTDINFSVGYDAPTKVQIHSAMGELIATPANAFMQAGEYTLHVPIDGLASGKYIVTIQCGAYSAKQNLVIVK